MIRFVLFLVIGTVIIATLTLLMENLAWIENMPSYFYQTLFFVPFTTLVIFAYLFKVSKPDVFVPLYLLTMVVKLLAYGAYVFYHSG